MTNSDVIRSVNKLSTSTVARDMEMSLCNPNWVTKLSLICNTVPLQIHFSGSSGKCKQGLNEDVETK